MGAVINPIVGYAMLKIAEQQYGKATSTLNEEELKQVERIVARQIEIERIVLSSDMAQGVIVPETEVENAFKIIRERYDDDDSFKQSLEQNGIDEKHLRQSLLHELRVESVMHRVAQQAPKVDETEARLYYYLHPEQFQQPEMRTARHILVTINPDYAENSREAAEQKMQQLSQQIGGGSLEKFINAAKKHSECPTALQGGMLGKVPRSTLFPELDQTLFSMQEGQVSAVVESEMGFHLLYCEKIYPQKTLPLAEVLPKLKQKLEDRERERHKKVWLKKLLMEVQRHG